MSAGLNTRRNRPIKTALHQAVLDGRLHQVRLLVSKQHSGIDARDLHGRTPLMLACLVTQEEFGAKMAKIFIDAGSVLSLKDHLGRTAMSYACLNGKEMIVKLIQQEFVLDISDADNDGNTPLHHAAVSGNHNVVKLLSEVTVKFGLDIDMRNNLGYTPLLLACKLGQYALAHAILTVGKASPVLKDNELFLDAVEWVNYSRNMMRRVPRFSSPRRAVTAPAYFPVSREDSMYHRTLSPICRHVKYPPDPLTRSNTSSFRFPVIPRNTGNDKQTGEMTMDVENARIILLKAIQDLGEQESMTTSAKQPIRQAPTSAKIRALDNGSGSEKIVPDVRTIFRIYSEQYGYILQMREMMEENVRLSLKTRSSSRNISTPLVCLSRGNDDILSPAIPTS